MIIRAEKKGKFSIVLNSPFESNEISWKAKGILIYLLTKPNEWNLIINDLVNHSTDGKTSTCSGIDELIQAGYIVKQEQKIINGKFGEVRYIVSEKPLTGFTLTEKPPLVNTNRVKTKEVINYNIPDFGSNSIITDSCESVASSKELSKSHSKNNFQENVEQPLCKKETLSCQEFVSSQKSITSKSLSKNSFEEVVEIPTCKKENFGEVQNLLSAAAVSDPVTPTEPFYITRLKKKLSGKRLESFNDFWNAFNFKQGKAEAADEWLKIPSLTDSSVKIIIDAAKRESENRPLIISQGRQPKWAVGWIAGRRWEDEQPQLQQPQSQFLFNGAVVPNLLAGNNSPVVVAGGFMPRSQNYSNSPMFGQATPYGFPSTGSRKMDNNLAICQAAIEMRKQISQNQAVNHD